MKIMNQVTNADTTDPTWKSLYKVGGAAALIAVVFYLTEGIFFFFVEMPPGTITDWFSLFQSNRLLGLFYLNALDIASIALFGPMFLALYLALKRDNESYMAIATLFAFIGIAVFIAPRSATLSMLSLSDQYAAATTEAQRSQILAAGQAVGALGQPTPQTTGFLLIAVAVLIISVVMLRSTLFNKVTVYVGILASVLTFANDISLVIVPSLADLLMGIGGVLWIIWWLLISRRLFQLGRDISQEAAH
jgi:hypothetical protein